MKARGWPQKEKRSTDSIGGASCKIEAKERLPAFVKRLAGHSPRVL